MRKFFAFLTVMLLILNFFTVNADSAIDSREVLAESVFGKNGFNIGINSQGEDVITRAEMAKIMYNISNGGKDILNEVVEKPRYEKFNDVGETHWAYEYIEALRSEGIFNGDGDGNFKPDQPCKYVDFVKTAISVTGYSVLYNSKGFGDTYFEKCYKIAQKMNINLSDFTVDGYVTANDVYLILFDMLFVPQIREVSYAYPSAFYATSYNLLKLKYGIEVYLGYFNKNDENLYLLSDSGLNFTGTVCNDEKFESG